MTIQVQVRQDIHGFYAAGYTRNVPLDVNIVGMYTAQQEGFPTTAQDLLRIDHPSFGMLGINETQQSFATRLNAVMCCDASGALVAPVDSTPPTISSGALTDTHTIHVVVSESVTGTIVGWSATINGGSAITPDSVTGTGANRNLVFSETFAPGDVILLNYAQVTGDTVDTATIPNELVGFTNYNVTNPLALPNNAEWLSVATDPYTGLLTADAFTYTGTAAIASTSSNIVIDVHAHTDNYYLIIRYPSANDTKSKWDESGTANLNVNIPGVQFPHAFNARGYHYIVSDSVVFNPDPAARVTLHV